MLVFVIGSALFSGFLGWQTFVEYQTNRPSDIRGWSEFGVVVAAQVCVWAVTIKAAVS